MTPSDQVLYPDAAQRIMTLMKNTFGIDGEVFNAYYLGMPDNFVPPQSAFPLMIVDKTDGSYKVGPTTADDITETVVIHIMVDVKTGFGAPDNDNYVKRQLQTVVEGRDPVTGYLLNPSVLYTLRTKLTLNSQNVPGVIVINNDVEVNYMAPVRHDLPETREAVITVTVTERQVVLNRS